MYNAASISEERAPPSMSSTVENLLFIFVQSFSSTLLPVLGRKLALENSRWQAPGINLAVLGLSTHAADFLSRSEGVGVLVAHCGLSSLQKAHVSLAVLQVMGCFVVCLLYKRIRYSPLDGGVFTRQFWSKACRNFWPAAVGGLCPAPFFFVLYLKWNS